MTAEKYAVTAGHVTEWRTRGYSSPSPGSPRFKGSGLQTSAYPGTSRPAAVTQNAFLLLMVNLGVNKSSGRHLLHPASHPRPPLGRIANSFDIAEYLDKTYLELPPSFPHNTVDL